MNDTVDQSIDKLIQKIEAKKQALAPLEKSLTKSWKTKAVVYAGNNFQAINLLVANMQELQGFTATLLMLKDYIDKTQKLLSIEEPYLLQGSSIEDWLEDCQKRASTLKFKSETERLDNLDAKLRKNMSSDKKRQVAIEEVEAELA